MQLIKELETRKHFIEGVIRKLEFNISKYPEGSIQCHKDYDNKKIIRFYRFSNDGTTYLSESNDCKEISLLLQKKYELKVLQLYQKELKAVDKLLNIDHTLDEFNNLSSFYEYSRKYIRRIEYSVKERIDLFQSNSHGSSSSRTGQYRVTTKEGVLVKSKAEQIIADELYDSGIPFKYELGIKCLDNSFRSPDFTVMNPVTGKIFYWEHFGMMDRPEYVRDKVDKMNSYSLSGIIPGDNLIMTIADDRRLDVKSFVNQVRRIIRKVLM